MHNDLPLPNHKLKGSALIMILIMVGVLAVLLVSALKSNPQIERDKNTADVMAKAKEALIGYAATYRDTHPGEVFGYLPCPATDGNGVAGCGAPDVIQIGLLPWKTLGLPPLRDSTGECLWYAVSGNFKNPPPPPTTPLNWDTAGQLIVNDAGGAILATGVAAVIFSPRGAINGQDRTPAAPATECGGNTTVAAYLDGNDHIYAAGAVSTAATLTVATTTSLANNTNNDRGLWITPTEIFDRVKRRSDFITDITNLLSDVKTQAAMNAVCTVGAVFNPPTAGITDPGGLGKSVGLAPASQPCFTFATPQRKAVYDNWRNNVLYAVCPGGTACLNVNGSTNCGAVAIFSGERAGDKVRPSVNAADYLEGVNNLSAFTSTSTTITGAGPYDYKLSSADIALCIAPLTSPPPAPPGSGQKYPSFIQTAYTKNMINKTAAETINWGGNGHGDGHGDDGHGGDGHGDDGHSEGGNGTNSGLSKLTFAWGSITATGGTISADGNSIGVNTGNKVSLAAGEALTYTFNEPRHSIDVRLKKVDNSSRSFRLTAKGTDNNYYVINVPNCTSSGTTFFGGMRFGAYDTNTNAANPNPNSTMPTYPIPFPNADAAVEYTEIKIEATGASVIQLDGFDSRGSYEGLQGASNASVFSPNPVPTYEADSSLPHPYPQCFWDVMNYYCPRVNQPAECKDWNDFQRDYHYNTSTRFGFEPIDSSDSMTQVKMDAATNVYSFRNQQGHFSTNPYQTLNIGGYTYYIGSYNRTGDKNFTAKLYTDQALTTPYNDRVPLDTPYWLTLTGTGFSTIAKTGTNTFTFTDAAADFNDVFVKMKIGSTTYYLKNSNPNNTRFSAALFSDPQMTVPVTVAPPLSQAYTLTTMSL